MNCGRWWVIGLCALGSVGCKNREADLPGVWKGSNLNFTVLANHTFWVPFSGETKLEGSWALDGDDVIFTSERLGAQSLKMVKQKMRTLARHLGSAGPKMPSLLGSLDQPNIMRLSSDGRLLTTDKSRDQNSEPFGPLVKQSAP